MSVRRLLSLVTGWALVLLIMLPLMVAASGAGLDMQPVITEAYELEPGKVLIEWTGQSQRYQVYMDGKHVSSTDVPSAVIDVKKGTHTIRVVPASDVEGSPINLEGYGISLGFSLPATATGIPSDAFSFDYIPDPLPAVVPSAPEANMDVDNVVLLSIVDHYAVDEYFITMKQGNNTSNVRIFPEKDQEYITMDGNLTTIRLDPLLLKNKGGMRLVLGQEYTFTITYRKIASSLFSGMRIPAQVMESRESEALVFIPVEAWRMAPEIELSQQSGEGQAMLRWRHEAGKDAGCEYDVLQISKLFSVKTSELKLLTTGEQEALIPDLKDGKYTFVVVPHMQGVQGTPSEEAHVTIQNTWDRAPEVRIGKEAYNQLRLDWKAVPGIDTYYVRVSVSDSASLLRYVNMAYKEYRYYVLPVQQEDLSLAVVYEGTMEAGEEVKLKIEVWGGKHSQSGAEMLTKTAVETLALKPE